MSPKIDRGDFLKKSVFASTGLALGMSFEEKNLAEHMAAESDPAAQEPSAPSTMTMPMGQIGPLKISRLICGGNLISGYAHDRDLIYVSELINSYNTDERVMDTWELCEERGINAVLSDPREKPLRILQRYWNERGGKIQWISEGHPKSNDIRTNLQQSIDSGAAAIYIQGGVGDRFVKNGRVDLIGESVAFIKKNGLVAGVGCHSIEVPKACEEAGIEADFYMKTLHKSNYWSFNPDKVDFGPFHADTNQSHDNVWDTNAEETIRFMKTVKKPWLAFKTMAAGAIHPKEAFKFAFENGADFVVAGMFDFQIKEDTMIARDILASLRGRARPWRA